MKIENIKQYEVIEQKPIKEVDSMGYLLRHKKSGARVFLLENADPNKVFFIGFRTPPANDTGVAHIMEHSVLCGSRKYPVKDPFVELAKGSLNTFLNAMTYADKTLYPLASCNDQDFCNLMSVYMDAVFYPNIYTNRKIFEQEGWHYELESPDGELKYNGVVYNEMKGAYSAPESALRYAINETLFPNGTYGKSSGGDPLAIPQLSYEQFLNFHRQYYHPSNSYIYLYGDMDMEERLDWLDAEYLSKFDRQEIDSAITKEHAFADWKDEQVSYSVTEGEDTKEKTFLSWTAVTGDTLNLKESGAYHILEYALLNAPGAPLKKALLDAGIGKEVAGGYSDSTCQPYFSIVVKGAEADQKDEFVRIIRGELQKAATEGLSRKSLLGGINNMEFKNREADYGRWPKGLIYGLNLENWFYEETAPLHVFHAEPIFAQLRESLESRYYEELVEQLLKTTYGAVVTAVPEPGLSDRTEREMAAKLAECKAGMTESQIQEIIDNTAALKAYQEEPSSKEALETIPMLTREDLSHAVFEPVNEWRTVGQDTKVLFHPIFTNGIGYLQMIFDASAVPTEDLGYLSLLGDLLSFVDTAHYSYGDLSDEINIHTGNLEFSTGILSKANDSRGAKVGLWVETKVLYREIPWVLNMIQEILFTSKFTDQKLIRKLVAEQYSKEKSAMLNSGHSVAMSRARSYCFEDAWLSAQISGMEYYEFIKDLNQNIEDRMELLVNKFHTILEQVICKDRLFIGFTADEEGMQTLEQPLAAFAQALPAQALPDAPRKYVLSVKNEGFGTASQVQYVARVGEFRQAGYAYTGAMQVFRTIMNYDYLWIKLRMQGGAYGCFAQLNRKGNGYFCSYRDPNLKETNDIYDTIPAYLEQFDVDERDMTRFIIGTISEMDVPLTPSMKGAISTSRYLNGLTVEECRREREEVLNCTVEDIRALAEPVRAMLDQQVLCVVGNAQKVEETEGLFMEKRILN